MNKYIFALIASVLLGLVPADAQNYQTASLGPTGTVATNQSTAVVDFTGLGLFLAAPTGNGGGLTNLNAASLGNYAPLQPIGIIYQRTNNWTNSDIAGTFFTNGLVIYATNNGNSLWVQNGANDYNHWFSITNIINLITGQQITATNTLDDWTITLVYSNTSNSQLGFSIGKQTTANGGYIDQESFQTSQSYVNFGQNTFYPTIPTPPAPPVGSLITNSYHHRYRDNIATVSWIGITNPIVYNYHDVSGLDGFSPTNNAAPFLTGSGTWTFWAEGNQQIFIQSLTISSAEWKNPYYAQIGDSKTAGVGSSELRSADMMTLEGNPCDTLGGNADFTANTMTDLNFITNFIHPQKSWLLFISRNDIGASSPTMYVTNYPLIVQSLTNYAPVFHILPMPEGANNPNGLASAPIGLWPGQVSFITTNYAPNILAVTNWPSYYVSKYDGIHFAADGVIDLHRKLDAALGLYNIVYPQNVGNGSPLIFPNGLNGAYTNTANTYAITNDPTAMDSFMGGPNCRFQPCVNLTFTLDGVTASSQVAFVISNADWQTYPYLHQQYTTNWFEYYPAITGVSATITRTFSNPDILSPNSQWEIYTNNVPLTVTVVPNTTHISKY